ncbi:MAG: hypothetical protein JRJ68_05290 [Deltaproteobacteria bacterium]|nr:hypothetical protein [Deltaproteobacteria bacterium]
MSCIRWKCQWVWLLLFSLFAIPAFAVDRVDTGFGNNGSVLNDFGFGDDEALALTVQADGKFLVAGYSSNGAVMNMAVARYLPDGSLDISFNYDGVFLLSMGSGDTLARSIAVREDGTIVVAGSAFDTVPRLAVVALTSDGYLDSSFGDNGQLVLPLQEEEIVTADLDVTEDGSIIVGATVRSGDFSRYPLLAKITANGKFDSEFGVEGTVKYKQDHDIEMRSLTLLEGEDFFIAGSIRQKGGMQAGLLKFKGDGNPDLTFGSGGEFLLNIDGEGSVINDTLADSNGDILVAGSVQNKGLDQAFAARLNPDGKVQSGFSGRKLFQSNLSYENVAQAVAIQQDGTVVLAGYGRSGEEKDLIVWSISDNSRFRLSSDDRVILDTEQQIVLRPLSVDDSLTGSRDLVDSGNDGEDSKSEGFAARKIVTDIGREDDTGFAIAALSSGEILAAGSSGNGIDKDFVLVRYAAGDKNMMSGAKSSAGGVATAGYKIKTSPVEDITRVSVVTGGTISDTRVSCEISCTAECGENTKDTKDSCYTSCLTECQGGRPTVVLRGVCYSVSPNPVYSDEKEEPVNPEPKVTSSEDASDEESEGGFYNDYFVRSGQTEDGSDPGSYVSEVLDITPDTAYYIRAYALLSDDTVIYGNEWNFKTDDACFIATAAYGTILDHHVVLLRKFRDSFLMPTLLGRKFVGIYYHFSPGIADFVRENVLLRGLVRVALWPLTLFALVMLKTTSAMKITGFVLTLLPAAFLLRRRGTVKREN